MKAFVLHGRRVMILMFVIFLICCTHLPAIIPANPAAIPETKERCHQPFLDIPYRFIHSIEASLPGGRTGTVIGITVVDPAAKTIHAVIMTLEGFVLFDAQLDKEMTVNRAVPPFNGKQFAERLMDDVRIIFLAPEGNLAESGVGADGSTVCRYPGSKDTIVDVIVHKNESWEIEIYSNNHKLLRKISAIDVQNRIPKMVELSGFGLRKYSLRLKLISAEPVSPEENRVRPEENLEDEE